MKTNNTKKILFALTLLVLSIISNGQYAVFFAIWIFTALLLFVVRKLPRWKGFLLAFLVIGIGYFFGTDVAPFLPLTAAIIITLVFSLLNSLPYLIDSFFSKQRKSFLSTLLFPCSFVIIEYTYHRFDPFDTWWHFASTQESQTVLLQSISVFGMGYITFLITWFASVSNLIYEQRNEWRTVKKGVLIYGLVLCFTLFYGGYRVQFQKTNSETIRIASIFALDSLNAGIDIEGINDQKTANDAKSKARRNTSKLNQYLFERSIEQAKAGAKIVFWAEGNAVVLKENENLFYDQELK